MREYCAEGVSMAERILGNRYLLKERIGIGGMASVYTAEDTTLDRLVAVKIMLPQYASDPSFAQRFRQEATAAAALQNPRIVSIHDWGCDGEDYFIVMELLTGSDMRAIMRNETPLDSRRIRDIGDQVCQALSVAHARKIIHRDITPQNIMVLPDGNVKVMDFGIAKVAGSSMTQTSTVLGTAHYLSPEQAQGRALTFASDLYSLGAVLYEAAAGRPVFDGPDPISVALQHVSADPIPLRAINPSVDAALEAIIMKALAKEPAKRFQSAEAMRKALAGDPNADGQTAILGVDQTAHSESTQVLPRQTATLPNTTLVMPSSSSDKVLKVDTDAIPKQPKKKRRWPAVVAILAMGLILSAVAVLTIKPWEPASLANTGEAAAETQNDNTPAQADPQEEPSADEEVLPEEEAESSAPSDTTPINRGSHNLPPFKDCMTFLTLEEAYQWADYCDDYVERAAKEFNAHYLDSREQRQASAEIATTAANIINNHVEAISEISFDVSLDFPWYNFYLDVQELYECLDSRIQAITSAWEISLSYESPSQHQSEILEPLERAKDATGSNRYFKRYKEVYPTIELPSLASDNVTESHIENAFVSFNLPELWADKVDVEYNGSEIAIRLKDDPSEKRDLLFVDIINDPEKAAGGDIGGGGFYSLENSNGQVIMFARTNYPWLAYMETQWGEGATSEIPDGLLSQYIELQTGGEYNLSTIGNVYSESSAGSCFQNYFERTIAPTIQVR